MNWKASINNDYLTTRDIKLPPLKSRQEIRDYIKENIETQKEFWLAITEEQYHYDTNGDMWIKIIVVNK